MEDEYYDDAVWHGEFTEELKVLYDQYMQIFGNDPDGYEDVIYDSMTYDVYVERLKYCIEHRIELETYIKRLLHWKSPWFDD